MHIQVNTDKNIDGHADLVAQAEAALRAALGSHADRVTRAEVHLSDVNAQKGGSDDIRCMIEARPEGLQPQAVTHNDADVASAIEGASRKLKRLLDSEFGKRDARR